MALTLNRPMARCVRSRCDCNPPERRVKAGKPLKHSQPDGPSEIIATPVIYNDRVYVAIGHEPEGGEGLGCLTCIDATKTGDISSGGKVWENREIGRSVSTASVADGLVYIADFAGVVHCLDAADGRELWQHDTEAHIWGSTLLADGRLYVGTENGTLLMLAPGKTRKVIGQIDLKDPIYSTPIAAGGRSISAHRPIFTPWPGRTNELRPRAAHLLRRHGFARGRCARAGDAFNRFRKNPGREGARQHDGPRRSLRRARDRREQVPRTRGRPDRGLWSSLWPARPHRRRGRGAHLGRPNRPALPEFGIGANDAGGCKLMLLPGQHKIELRKGDQAVATAAFDWSPSTWTCFKLRIAPTEGQWLIQAKVWKRGLPEPQAWMITTPDPQPPPPGRASIWGNDYSEQPIRFDDLRVTPLNYQFTPS